VLPAGIPCDLLNCSIAPGCAIKPGQWEILFQSEKIKSNYFAAMEASGDCNSVIVRQQFLPGLAAVH
jgi:hypothetical protein